MDLGFTLFVLLGFLAVVLALEGLYHLWSARRGAESRRIAGRLSTLAGATEWNAARLERIESETRLPALDRLLRRTGPGLALERHVHAAGLRLAASELVALSAGLLLVGPLLALVIDRSLVAGLAIGAGLASLPWLRVARQHAQRLQRFEQQFPEALDLMGRALRAGHALPTAVRMCGDELAAPMGPEFQLLADESTYGVPLDEALRNLVERVPVPDIGYFVVAVRIQRESGGNLAELLDNISALVRQRLKLHGQIRTLSAEGRLSAWILALLPFGTALLIHLVNPGFLAPLWTEALGQQVVGAALVLLLAGLVWMRSVIRIRV
jgi:tight adherence protein B